MFQQQERVPKQLFTVFLKKSVVYHESLLTLRVSDLQKITTNTEEKNFKLTERYFAFVVSKKVSRKAIIRNLLKRRARAIVRKYKEQIKYGFAYLFFFQEGAQNISFDGLEQTVYSLLQSSGSVKK